ncbi:phosphoinositide phospholipase C 4-like protein, partial [Trifolium pratense]
MGSYRVCLCFRRRFKSGEAVAPQEVRELFNKYAEGGAHMTSDQLSRFLAEVQGEVYEKDELDTQKVVEEVLQKRHHITKFARHNLTLDDFHHYLFSTELNSPIRSQVHQDMTAPLSHYFIYTGHNSYLTGNQLSSDCSDVPIIKALKRGVRVVELDIWPNSNKDDVIVLHGRTLTTPVDLIKCLKSIKEHAFSASPYPVIITLEDHLTSDLQAKAAQMITKTFGDMLFCPNDESLNNVPSPEELKYKIMISTKPPKEYLNSKSVRENSKQLLKSKSKDSDEDEWGKVVNDVVNTQNEDDKGDFESNQHNDDDDDESNDDEYETNQESEYKRLIAIRAGKPKGSLKEALKVEDDKVRRLSLSEQQIEKASESLGTDLIRFTQKNFLRIYPKGTRVTSSNYKPFVSWMHGAQMVAFNMQGPNNEVFNPKVKLEVKKTLKVKIYGGDGWSMDFKQTHFDLYSPPDFYVR